MANAKGGLVAFLGGIAEATYATHPSVGNGTTVKLPIVTSGLRAVRSQGESNVIRGRYDRLDPWRGNLDVSGPVVVPVDQIALGYWLQMLFGNPTTTGSSSPYTHAFKVTTMRSFVLEAGYTDIAQYLRFNGCMADSMTLRVGGDEEFTATFNMIASAETRGGSSMDGGTPGALTFTRFNGFNAAIKEGGTTSTIIKEFEMTISRNLDRDMYTIGNTGKLGALEPGLVSVTGRISALFQNLTLFNKGANETESQLQLTWTSGSYSLDILIQELIFQEQSPGIPTPGGVYLDLPFHGYYKDAAVDKTAIQITLVNSKSAYVA